MNNDYVLRQIGDVTVLEIQGRIVLGDRHAAGSDTAQLLHDRVREQVASGRKKILVNLHGVEYVDSSGLGELVSAFSTVLKGEGHLRFCGANERVREVLSATHLDEVLNFSVSEPEAIAAFNHTPGAERATA